MVLCGMLALVALIDAYIIQLYPHKPIWHLNYLFSTDNNLSISYKQTKNTPENH